MLILITKPQAAGWQKTSLHLGIRIFHINRYKQEWPAGLGGGQDWPPPYAVGKAGYGALTLSSALPDSPWLHAGCEPPSVSQVGPAHSGKPPSLQCPHC